MVRFQSLIRVNYLKGGIHLSGLQRCSSPKTSHKTVKYPYKRSFESWLRASFRVTSLKELRVLVLDEETS